MGRITLCSILNLIWINLLFVAAVRKDICEKCVKIENCPMFARMSKHQQQMWLEQVPCDISQNGGGSSIYGFSSIAKGDYVCCPSSNVWGIGHGNNNHNYPPEEKIRPNDNTGSVKVQNQNLNPKQRNNQATQIKPINQNINGNLQLGSNPNYRQPQPGTVNQNIYQGTPSNNQNQPGGEINQGYYNNPENPPDDLDVYGNPQNGFNNQDEYGNQQNLNAQYPNNGINSAGNPSQNYQSQYPNQLVQSGVMSPGQNQNPYYQGSNNYPQQQPQNQYSNNGNGNSYDDVNADQQCAVQSSVPPDPATGCCGKDMSDSDRITDLQSILNMYAPPRRNNPQQTWPQQNYPSQQNYPPNNSYYPQRRKRSAKNTTAEVVLDNRIAGGKETELDQFPWTALLKVTFDYGKKQASFSCGGSLISPKYILTAGHCVYEAGAKIIDIEITLAEYDKRTFPRDCKSVMGQGKQCIDNVVMHAENVIHHPQYDDDRLNNDIALIRLHGYAPYTRFIRSICLPPVNIDNSDFSNLPLAVAGWGRNGPYVTDIKQSTVVHLVPHDECQKSYPHLTLSHLCAAGRTGEDTCKGDSGGPLMMLYRGSYYIIGVVSGKRADSPCGTTVPSLYTNVYQYVQWIMANIKD